MSLKQLSTQCKIIALEALQIWKTRKKIKKTKSMAGSVPQHLLQYLAGVCNKKL